jgi:hypothetical protein
MGGDTDDHAAVSLLLLTALAALERGGLPRLAQRAWGLLDDLEAADPMPEGDRGKAGGTETCRSGAISDRVFRLMVRRYELQEVRYRLKRRQEELKRQRTHHRDEGDRKE